MLESLPEPTRTLAQREYSLLLSRHRHRLRSKPSLFGILAEMARRKVTGFYSSALGRKGNRCKRDGLKYTRARMKALGIPWRLKDRKPGERDAVRTTPRRLPREAYLAMTPDQRERWFAEETERLRLYQEHWAQMRNRPPASLTGDWLRAGSDRVRIPPMCYKRI